MYRGKCPKRGPLIEAPSEEVCAAYQIIVRDILIDYAKGNVKNLTFIPVFSDSKSAHWKQMYHRNHLEFLTTTNTYSWRREVMKAPFGTVVTNTYAPTFHGSGIKLVIKCREKLGNNAKVRIKNNLQEGAVSFVCSCENNRVPYIII